MLSKSSKIDDLKRIIKKNLERLDKNYYAGRIRKRTKITKMELKSIEYLNRDRSEVNRAYGQKNLTYAQLYKILIYFNGSIAFAPKDSEELAAAYANKSAVLLRMRKYRECIEEIDRASKITESLSLKIKMLCRKAECLTALGSSDNRSYLEKAKFSMTKVELLEREKDTLKKLIKKTQRVIDDNRLDIPKEEKKKIHALKILREVERRDLSEMIGLECSRKYGRHLVAARDFTPGEILLVEKSFFNSLECYRAGQYCDRCFNPLWTAVACDYCSRRVYCCEECKIEAWNDHHDMECFVSANIVHLFQPKMDGRILFVLGVFFKAVREAGSIEQLLADSESLVQHSDEIDEKVSSSADLKSYKNIFTLPTPKLKRERLENCIENSIGALIGLAKYSKFLGKRYNFEELASLARDDRAILVGALLLKFAILLRIGCPEIHLTDPNKHGDPKEVHRYSTTLPLLTMHTLIGCVPNAEIMYTYGNRFILFAIRPIKAGDQIVLHSASESIWNEAPKTARQIRHKVHYRCLCECEACIEDWSDIILDKTKFSDPVDDGTHSPEALRLWDERNSILSEWEAASQKPSYPDLKLLSRSRELATAAWTQLSMPSPVIFHSVLLLIRIARAFYDPFEIFGKVPHLRTIKYKSVYNSPH